MIIKLIILEVKQRGMHLMCSCTLSCNGHAMQVNLMIIAREITQIRFCVVFFFFNFVIFVQFVGHYFATLILLSFLTV